MKYRVVITDEVKQDDEDLYIIVGGAEFCDVIPKKYIVYQFEQTNVTYNNVKDIWFTQKYIHFLKNALDVWDYSMSNVEYLKKNYDITSIRYIPLRYSSSIDRAPKIHNKDIDVLFMGSLSDRRKRILDNLGKKVNLHIGKNNLWREERDKLVSRSKIIIKIQFYDNGILELPRISYLLSNRALVISEKGREKNLSKEMDKYMVTCTYKLLETKILEYLKKPNLNQIRKKFYAKWKETDYSKNFDFIKLYPKEFIKTKSISKKRRKKGKINYYVPKNIESIEFKVSTDGFCSLRLPSIPDDELPNVSIITPTKNRGFIFKLAIYNFYNFIYPPNKLEWVILDNGSERVENLLPNDKRIKYIKLDPNEEYAIGFLRNKCIENSSHEHICYMDDDDYYRPESILARIKSLIKYSSEGVNCVGCAQVGCYYIRNKQSVIGTNNPMFIVSQNVDAEDVAVLRGQSGGYTGTVLTKTLSLN